MASSPSDALIALLARLRLATAGQTQSVAARVHRLARDLPSFDSVWVDALAQARLLTPFQAAEINAGRGSDLAVGRYVLRGRIAGPSFGRSFAAVDLTSQIQTRLLLIDPAPRNRDDIATQLERLVERSRLAKHPALRPVRRAGIDEHRPWAACAPDRGVVAARWLVENGRFPPAVVLGVARQMAAALVELERLEIVHGDLSAWGTTIDLDGHVGLICPGLRPVARPAEGYAFGDLQPEAFDTLAPERIESGAAASVATDIYACGCLWWHLATGRPPFAGGSTIAKLKAVHRAKAPDIEQLTVDASPRLLAAIRACMAVDPADRPPDFAAVAAMLGASARSRTGAMRKMLARNVGPRRLWGPGERRPSLLGKFSRATAIAACLALLLAAPVGWRHRHALAWWPKHEIAAAKHPAEVAPRRTGRDSGIAAEGGGVNAAASAAARPEMANAGAKRDDRVQAASFVAPRSVVEPRLLESDRPLRLGELNLRSGQTVRGVGVRRPLVVVAADGLRVRGEDVCFENVDFVWDQAPADGSSLGAAIIWLEAQRAEFRGCSFQDARRPKNESPRGAARPTAIAWLNGADTARASPLPGELTLDHCVFWNVDAAVECRSSRSLEIDARETLHACSGPLVRLAQATRRNQTVLLNLANVTLRAASAALECPVRNPGEIAGEDAAGASAAGRIAVEAIDSVFAIGESGALLLADCPRQPDRFVGQVEWTGEGSLVTPATPIAAWRDGRDGTLLELADDGLRVAGLVRSQVEFAGAASEGPEAARLRRWQAPQRSSEPPGVGPGRLTLPRLGR